MASINFVDQSTVITADWLNEQDAFVHGLFGGPADVDTQVFSVVGGTVGIGELTTPAGKLHVKTSDASIVSWSSTANTLVLESNTSNGMTIGVPSTANANIFFADEASAVVGWVQYKHPTDDLAFGSGGAEALVLDSSQNAGFKGHINLLDNKNLYVGTGNDARFVHDGANTYIMNDNVGALFIRNNVNSGLVSLDSKDSGGTVRTGIQVGGATPDVNLFYNGDEMLRTDSTGIVIRAGYTGAGSAIVNVGGSRTADGAAVVKLQSSSNSTNTTNFTRYGGLNAVGEIRHYGTGALQFVTQDAANMLFYTNNTEQVRITSDGGVGMSRTAYTSVSTDGFWFLPGTSGLLSLSLNTSNAVMYLNQNGSGELVRGFFSGTAEWWIKKDAIPVMGLGTASGASWDTLDAAIEVGDRGAVAAWAGNTYLANNAYYDTTNGWSYKSANVASLYQQSGAGSHIFYNKSSGTIDTSINFNELARIDADGIKFNGDTAAANGLDDYEEGSWTPTYTDGTNNASAYTFQVGEYVKIGNMVHVTFDVQPSNIGSVAGNTRIGGLPFTVDATKDWSGSIGYAVGLSLTAGVALTCYGQTSNTLISVRMWDGTGGTGTVTTTEWPVNGRILGSLSYSI